jgi:hypothetical protein
MSMQTWRRGVPPFGACELMACALRHMLPLRVPMMPWRLLFRRGVMHTPLRRVRLRRSHDVMEPTRR